MVNSFEESLADNPVNVPLESGKCHASFPEVNSLAALNFWNSNRVMSVSFRSRPTFHNGKLGKQPPVYAGKEIASDSYVKRHSTFYYT